jgi:hypothetical protein
MHILLVADGRSPTTKSWIRGLQDLDYQITLVSTFPCQKPEGIEHMHVVPVAFSGLAGGQMKKSPANGSHDQSKSSGSGTLRQSIARFRDLFLSARYVLGPLTIPRHAKLYQRIIDAYQPDIVHALRVPFEGMLAGTLKTPIPFIASIWGNDLTLHAKGSRQMRQITTRTLRRANGLMADANRDIRLGRMWGLSDSASSLVVPGSGGVELDRINQAISQPNADFEALGLSDGPLVINPRGFRPGSVRNDVFFQAVALIAQRMPEVRFVCPAMAGQPEAERWLETLGISEQVHLLPYLSQETLWHLFKRAQVSVSISSHDGTPNSLLEAMAIGCFPIAGDIESIREWITPGSNGFLVEPDKPQVLAEAIIVALKHPELLLQARQRNQQIIEIRASREVVQKNIDSFYEASLKVFQEESLE